jgi:hypothetical protein
MSYTREQVTEEEHIFTYDMGTVNWYHILWRLYVKKLLPKVGTCTLYSGTKAEE